MKSLSQLVSIPLILLFINITLYNMFIYPALGKVPDFKSIGFHLLDTGLQQGRIIAFGDFDNNRLNDVVILNQDQNQLDILLWNHDRSKFILHSSLNLLDFHIPIIKPTLISNRQTVIVNVFPTDFNQDGYVDFLVLTATVEHNVETDSKLVLFLNDGNSFIIQSNTLDLHITQPFTVDLLGDLTPQFLYTSVNSTSEGSSNPLMNLSYDKIGTFKSQSATLFDKVKQKAPCRPSHPHYNSFVDLDGDCLADLFITCEVTGDKEPTAEIWINDKENGFYFAHQIQLPQGYGPISFADMDADGAIDLVFGSCTKEMHCMLHVVYNKQIGICSNSIERNCRSPTSLCKADPNFSFDMNSPEYHTIFDFDTISKGHSILFRDYSFVGTLPSGVRLGDYNNDGFPDMLVTSFLNGSPSSNSVELLQSVPCSKDICSPEAFKSNRRFFQIVQEAANSFSTIPNHLGGAFIDVDDNGILDIILFSKGSNGIQSSILINNFYNDAFFLKTTVLNGVCLGPCGGGPHVQGYGVNYVGATIKYSIIDSSGSLRVSQVSQLPQQSYQALLSATSHIGLGRTNNYIEDLFVGVSSHAQIHFASYQGLIPNSIIVIGPSTDIVLPDEWRIEMYMNPSSTASSILTVLAITIVTLGILVFVLETLERVKLLY
ncbi:hypothetical protein BC833DRAFT_600315 [Globomyces pollinis-pini]|nr:hypothetical protein BC833DRAFT_600315 [Globomyces pollinis-pini]